MPRQPAITTLQPLPYHGASPIAESRPERYCTEQQSPNEVMLSRERSRGSETSLPGPA
jgi:hypothetical protein